MRSGRFLFLLLAPVLLAVLAGCRPASAPEAFFFQSVPSDGWNPRDVVEFTPDCVPQGDSVPFAARELERPLLWIRYGLNAPERLPLVVICEQLDRSAPLTDTLSVTLFRNQLPAGKGQRGLYEIALPLPEAFVPMARLRTDSAATDSVTLPSAPGDSVTLAPGWRLTLYPVAEAKGVSEIGISF